MKLRFKLFVFVFLFFVAVPNLHAKSVRGHFIGAGSELANVVVAPVKGLFYTGPQEIAEAYDYEVNRREKEEKRGLLRYKLFAIWRAPGEEVKATVSGVTESVKSCGNAVNEIVSAFFSD